MTEKAKVILKIEKMVDKDKRVAEIFKEVEQLGWRVIEFRYESGEVSRNGENQS